jgi:ribonuclease-3
LAAGDIRQTGRHTTLTSRADWAESKLHYRFSNPELLEQALTHRSAGKPNNERLEFLGDAFLNFVIADRLYARRAEHSEGDLSRARASLVRQSTRAEIARALGLDDQLVLGRGELRSGASQRAAILADAFEALIGAVLLDGGHAAAEALIAGLFADRFDQLPEPADLKDSKTKLQEWLQGRGMRLPSYSIDSVHGREHEQVFTVVCEVKTIKKGKQALGEDEGEGEGEGEGRDDGQGKGDGGQGAPGREGQHQHGGDLRAGGGGAKTKPSYLRTSGSGRSRRLAEQRAAAAMLEELQSHAE